MSSTTHTHLLRGPGATSTVCGRPAGVHHPLKVTVDPAQTTCPRCLRGAHRGPAPAHIIRAVRELPAGADVVVWHRGEYRDAVKIGNSSLRGITYRVVGLGAGSCYSDIANVWLPPEVWTVVLEVPAGTLVGDVSIALAQVPGAEVLELHGEDLLGDPDRHLPTIEDYARMSGEPRGG